MKKHTICTAAIEVLKKSNKPKLATEIFEAILLEKLYEFKAKEPLSMLKSMLRKHTTGIKMSGKKGTLYFNVDPEGKFYLINQ